MTWAKTTFFCILIPFNLYGIVLEDCNQGALRQELVGKKIGYYPGTFKIFHDAHLAIVQEAVSTRDDGSSRYCDYLFVQALSDDPCYPTKRRPFWSLRQSMLEVVFACHPKVIVARGGIIAVLNFLQSCAGVDQLGVLGEDTFTGLSQHEGKPWVQRYMSGYQDSEKLADLENQAVQACGFKIVPRTRESQLQGAAPRTLAGRPAILMHINDCYREHSASAIINMHKSHNAGGVKSMIHRVLEAGGRDVACIIDDLLGKYIEQERLCGIVHSVSMASIASPPPSPARWDEVSRPELLSERGRTTPDRSTGPCVIPVDKEMWGRLQYADGNYSRISSIESRAMSREGEEEDAFDDVGPRTPSRATTLATAALQGGRGRACSWVSASSSSPASVVESTPGGSVGSAPTSPADVPPPRRRVRAGSDISGSRVRNGLGVTAQFGNATAPGVPGAYGN